MNIFDIYLDKIKKLVIKLNKKSLIEIPESLNGINVDVPPDKFDCDISTNVAMILSKPNKKSPLDLANQLSELIKKDDKNINLINVVNPGFINIKFKGSFWNNFLKEIKKDFNETRRQKLLASIRFRIFTTFNNSQGKAKHTTNGRPIKGIKERLAGKDGQIRNNMMGKRSVKFGTLVWEWNGNMKKAEDIKIGDVVIGDDGNPRKVLDTLKGRSLLYKIKQKEGKEYVVSCEHILTLKFLCHCDIVWKEKQSEWFMSWYDRNSKTVKTFKSSVKKEIEAFRKDLNTDPYIDIHVKDYLSLSEKNKSLMLGVKLNVPINWVKKSIKIDPRILGM